MGNFRNMYRLVLIFFLFFFSAGILQAQNSDSVDYKVFYYPNGNVSSEGYLRDGRPDGYWINYYRSGIKKSEGKRTNFLLDSTWIFYDQTGDTLKKITYRNGEKNGYLQSYYSRPDSLNSLKYKELYLNDQLFGEAFYYDQTGKLDRKVSYEASRKDGRVYHYDENRTIVKVEEYIKGKAIRSEVINQRDTAGKKTGVWKSFNERGNLEKEENFKKGIKEGIARYYDSNENLIQQVEYQNDNPVKIITSDESIQIKMEEKRYENGNLKYQGQYLDTLPVGTHRFYGLNGELENAKIYSFDGVLLEEGKVGENGVKKGDWKIYYSNGKLKASGFYDSRGRKDKTWTFYFIDGTIEQRGQYSANRLHGEWKWYYRNDMLRKIETYLYGEKEGAYREYDKSGNLLVEGNYMQDVREGEWLFTSGDHHESGEYFSGEKNGIWKSWYSNGQLRFKGNYVMGQPEGKHIYYYGDGTKKEVRYYDSGIRERIWVRYDEFGNSLMVLAFKDGHLFRVNGEKVHNDKLIE